MHRLVRPPAFFQVMWLSDMLVSRFLIPRLLYQGLCILQVIPPNDGNDPVLVDNYLANQTALASAGALLELPTLALHNGGVSDSSVRATALRCLGYSIVGNQANCRYIQEAHVSINTGTSTILMVC